MNTAQLLRLAEAHGPYELDTLFIKDKTVKKDATR